jgi:hypothetical protein
MSTVGLIIVGNKSHAVASFSTLVTSDPAVPGVKKITIRADLADDEVFPSTAMIGLVFTEPQWQKLNDQWSSDAP